MTIIAFENQNHEIEGVHKDKQVQICTNLYFDLGGVTIEALQEMSSGSSFRERVFSGASTASFFVSPVSSERT